MLVSCEKDDDQEFIDEGFLRSQGFTQDPDDKIKWTLTRRNGLPIGMWKINAHWKAVLVFGPHAASDLVRWCDTRGELRRLLLGLKVHQLEYEPDF